MSTLKDLDRKIKNYKQKHNKDNSVKKGFLISAELFAGVVVGGAIGYLLDKFFSTKPLFFAVCLIVGFLAGLLNIYKYMK